MIGIGRTAITGAAAIAAALALGVPAHAKQSAPTEPIVSVSADGRDLEVKRAVDSRPVRVPVLDRCGDPEIGEPKIRYVQVRQGSIDVVFGKHCFARVSLKTLAIECPGCD